MASVQTGFDYMLFAQQVKKNHGDDILVNLKSTPKLGSAGTFIPTSSEELNLAINGGIPCSRIVEIYGLEAGGKSTLTCDIAAHAQQMTFYKGRPIFYGDAENAFNPAYFEAMGGDLDPKRFILVQSNEAEEMLDIALEAAKANAAVIIVDSIAGLDLKSDMEGIESTETRVGGISKALRAHLRKMKGVIGDTKAVAIYINQITYKIGQSWGNPETTTGGGGLRFFSSLRLDVRAGGKKEDKGVDKATGEVDSIISHVKVVKSRVSPPFRTADFTIKFGRGIDEHASLASTLIARGIVTKASAGWIKVGDQKWQGEPAFANALAADAKLTAKLREELWKE